MPALTLPSLSLPTTRTSWIALAATLAVVGPATALILFKASVSGHATVTSGKRTPKSSLSSSSLSKSTPTPRLPTTLPPAVSSPTSTHILCYERAVSRPIPSSNLMDNAVAAFVRSSMTAFNRTPQAFAIRAAVSHNAEAYQSFDPAVIASKRCKVGDLFGGVYRVVYRGDGGVEGNDRVEMMFDVPEGSKAPVVEGMIIAGVEKAEGTMGEEVVLINETWMWRREGDRPVLLESRIGSWVHELMVMWFAKRGVRAATRS